MSETVTADQPARRAARKGSINRLDPEGTAADAETKQAAREPARQPAPHGRAEALDRDGNPIYRKRDNTEDKFYVPQDLKEDGWDYQWNCYSVLGEQNMSAQINDAENGWRPVPADRPAALRAG